MFDVLDLQDAVDALADRFRAMPQSRLLGAVEGHRSRAAAALALARELAATAQLVEFGPAGPPREIPEAGAFAVGDQLAVAGHDLVAALGPLEPQARIATRDGAHRTAADLLAEAVAAVGAVSVSCS
ncbi:hypothetical protein C7C46_10390 [Streptomyces tateyamensis]|uniref:Uncharacterized protein n=1 Tax=Streptomyces tateyamensis TaxID=565073 RepID=A0A2V4NFW9_9ACTN|nr:hypothetical protein [Streptomyces tateyamensis]PYC82745.1 hypothetical protein C7C46_10390 [Streptomyces tateyamensis]